MQRRAATDALLSLFGPEDNGLLFDNLARQAYRDTALTTLISADGQAVAGLKDRSGSGNDALQATAASQATYDTDTAVPNLTFDGGDYYTTTYIPSNQVTFAAAITAKSAGKYVLGIFDGTYTAALIVSATTSKLRFDFGTKLNESTDTFFGVDAVLVGRGDADTGVSDLWINGQQEATSSQSPFTFTSEAVSLGTRVSGGAVSTAGFTGSLYRAFAINRYVTDDEVQILTKALATGVVTL